MAKIGIILISDYHYGIVRNHFSLTELIRSDIIDHHDEYSIRHIVAKNVQSVCRVYPHKLEELRSFCNSNDKNICVIGLGLSNYKSGYDFEMFENHIKGLISELHHLDNEIDIGLLNCEINNNLKGHFCFNYKKFKNIISMIENNKDIKDLRFSIKILFLNNGDYVISTKTIPNMIKSITEFIKSR